MVNVSLDTPCMFHVVTVGTSILVNLPKRSPAEFKWCLELLGGAELEPGEDMVGRAAGLLALEPREMSAEINAMYEYLEKGLVDEALLLATDTPAGRTAARVLEAYLRERGVAVETKVVEDLGRVFEQGLINLASEAAKAIEQALNKGCRVLLNLTGGFKPETAFLYLAGSLLGAHQAYYIHETLKTHVVLPIVPLQIPHHIAKAINKALEAETAAKPPIEALEEKDLLDKHGLLKPNGEPVELAKTLLRLQGKAPG